MSERDDMVERVARAICVSEKMNDDDALGGWVHWVDAARAAIEAMREPTEAVHAKLDEMLDTFVGPDAERRDIMGVFFIRAWRAAIDASLNTGKEE